MNTENPEWYEVRIGNFRGFTPQGMRIMKSNLIALNLAKEMFDKIHPSIHAEVLNHVKLELTNLRKTTLYEKLVEIQNLESDL